MAIVKGTTAGDWIDASDGVTNDADVIYGYDGNDIILGLGGNDTIYGMGDNDTLFGMDGNDLLKGGGGADLLNGGEDIDTASYSDSAQAVQIYLHLGIVQGGTAQGDTLVSIENLTGSNYGDILSGDDGSNVLNGLAGDDMLFGRGGADTLNGGDGIDSLVGGAGADILNGGSDFDEVEYITSPTAVSVSLLSGKGAGGDAQGDQLIGIEGITGSDFGDILVGDNGENCVWGYGGGDLIYGYGGDDHIFGHDGNDTLYGMDGIDFLSGDAGADHIHGGLGNDTQWGGSGADIFLWSSAAEAEYDLTNLACTTDHVCDFNQSEGDVMDLSAIDANENVNGNQGFTFIGMLAFSGNPGEINYFYDGGDTYIRLQTDASPDVEGMIRLVGIHTPEATWFSL